jgi:hypothetical protein
MTSLRYRQPSRLGPSFQCQPGDYIEASAMSSVLSEESLPAYGGQL